MYQDLLVRHCFRCLYSREVTTVSSTTTDDSDLEIIISPVVIGTIAVVLALVIALALAVVLILWKRGT